MTYMTKAEKRRNAYRKKWKQVHDRNTKKAGRTIGYVRCRLGGCLQDNGHDGVCDS